MKPWSLPSSSRIVPLFFFFSGMTSLIYEVIWFRMLTLTFGAAAFAVASVMLAYMGGLCVGSFCFGQIADRVKNHVRIYAVLEVLIAVYALLLPQILEWVSSFYVFIYQRFEPSFYPMSLIRLLCSTLVLIVPTFLMGGTLPILASSFSKESEPVARRVAALYSINTLGAASGCLLAGYLLIPKLGLDGTTLFASIGNFGIFLAAFFYRFKSSAKMEETPVVKAKTQKKKVKATAVSAVPAAAEALPQGVVGIVLFSFALSGLCAMAYQNIWTRLLSMVIGTMVYAYTGILAVFLLGIVLGSWMYRGWFAKQPFLAFALTQFGVGAFVLASMPLFDELPFLFLKIFEATKSSWVSYQFARLLLPLMVLIFPTICFGMSFPLVIEICRGRAGATGKTVGTIYAINTFGAIIGSFVGGFVLIPFLGLQKGLAVLAFINAFSGMVLLICHPRFSIKHKAMQLGAAFSVLLVLMALLRPWNLHYLNSGPYVYAHDYNKARDTDHLKEILNSYKLKFFKEDATATVSVFDIMGTLALSIDGKTDASTGKNADMSTQILLAHLPALMAKTEGESLLVGLGSGVSLGSLLNYDIPKIDVLEISEAVAAAADFFKEYNGDALRDPRVNLVVGDGRHHLLRTQKEYSLIVSQPSNPWVAGVSTLFTREYYQLMHDRVTQDGIVCQWIPSYHMSKDMIGVILKSFAGVFPYVTLWSSSVPGDLFAIGSKSPIVVDFPQFLARLDRPQVRKDLARIKMDNPWVLAKTFRYGDAQMKDYLAKNAQHLPENTDSFPIIEFMSPPLLLHQQMLSKLVSEHALQGNLSSLMQHIHFEEDQNKRSFLETAQAILSPHSIQ